MVSPTSPSLKSFSSTSNINTCTALHTLLHQGTALHSTELSGGFYDVDPEAAIIAFMKQTPERVDQHCLAYTGRSTAVLFVESWTL
eukprot:1011632-Amphidinium_carterae.1